MRQNLWKQYAAITLLLFLMGSAPLKAGAHATTFDPDVYSYTSSDSPIIISAGTTVLHSGHHYTITADSGDVEVVLEGNAFIEGDSTTSLNFITHSGNTITITGDHDVTFQGTDARTPLLVTFGGLGNIIFDVVGGNVVNIGSSKKDKPARAFVLMDDVCGSTDNQPTLVFKRKITKCNSSTYEKDVVVSINKHSLLSYLSLQKDLCQAHDQGAVIFDVGNVEPSCDTSCPGSMILRVKDGGFVMAGHWVDLEESDSCNDVSKLYEHRFCLDDIKLPIAAGHRAIAQVVVNQSKCGSKVQGGLIVENYNSSLFELLSDPFCYLKTRQHAPCYAGAFNGLRFGFVLGANAVLDICNNTFVDYRAFGDNICPDIPSLLQCKWLHGKAQHVLKKRNPSAFFVDGNNNPKADSAQIYLGKHSGLFFRSLFNSHWDDDCSDRIVDRADRALGEGEYVFIVEAPLRVHGKNECDKELSKIEILSLQVAPCGELFPGDHKKQFPVRTFNRKEACDYGLEGLYLTYNKAAWLVNSCIEMEKTSLVHTDVNHAVFEKNDVQSEPTYVGGEKWVIGCGQKTDCHTVCDRRSVDVSDSSTDEWCPEECREIICVERPCISLINSRFDIHTDVALTGLDVRVPNKINGRGECLANRSKMVFYQNGKRVDCGFGRNMILGTQVGSLACDMCTVINPDVHVNIVQEQEGDYCPTDHILALETASNSSTIVECVKKRVAQHPGVNSIYLGYNSNISIGSHLVDADRCEFEAGTTPTLFINGNYFAISARGGSICDPRAAHITGQGGIFVDHNGKFCIGAHYRAAMDTMVTRSMGGQVNLPANQVVFGSLFGIADWKLDLSHEKQRVIVDFDEHISHYTFNCLTTACDHNNTWNHNNHSLYRVPSMHKKDCAPVIQENITDLATVKGFVDEFQIQGSRIGEEAQVLIDGGSIQELVFEDTDHAGEIAAAVVVLKNEGFVGVGPAFPESESVFASTTLGINGITIIADGTGRVALNHDMVIANRCAFVKGPNFKSGVDVLEISSNAPRTLRVKATGSLDFQSFDKPEDIVQLGGLIRLIMEPGSSIIMGGGTLQIANDVTVVMEPSFGAQHFFKTIRVGAKDCHHGNPLAPIHAALKHNTFAPLTKCGDGLTNTDAFRIKIHGQGTIRLVDDARLFIDKNAYVGIETLYELPAEPCIMPQEDDKCFDPCAGGLVTAIPVTNITLELKDNALVSLGGDAVSQGGSLQVGNTENRFGHDVKFTLLINGLDARFVMGAQSFFGLNGGIVRRNVSDVPNDWVVDTLWNVSAITIDVEKGLFSHSQIYAGDDPLASLLMIGRNSAQEQDQVTFNLIFPKGNVRRSSANIHGGGNIVMITRGLGAFHPVVLNQDGLVTVVNDKTSPVTHANLFAGMLASRALMLNVPITNANALQFFEFIKTTEGTTSSASRDSNLGNAAIDVIEASGIAKDLRIGVIDRGTILREPVTTVIDVHGGTDEDKVQRASDFGAVGVTVDLHQPAPSTINTVVQIAT